VVIYTHRGQTPDIDEEATEMKKIKMTREIAKWVHGYEGTGESVTCVKTEESEFCGFGYKAVWVSDDGRKFENVIRRGYYNYFVEI
jgi:hypothetical protein